jgi:hypothetical protein
MSSTAASNELKLGTSGGKVGFYGKSPVSQSASISNPAEELKAVKEKLEAVIKVLKEVGLTA